MLTIKTIQTYYISRNQIHKAGYQSIDKIINKIKITERKGNERKNIQTKPEPK